MAQTPCLCGCGYSSDLTTSLELAYDVGAALESKKKKKERNRYLERIHVKIYVESPMPTSTANCYFFILKKTLGFKFTSSSSSQQRKLDWNSSPHLGNPPGNQPQGASGSLCCKPDLLRWPLLQSSVHVSLSPVDYELLSGWNYA